MQQAVDERLQGREEHSKSGTSGAEQRAEAVVLV